MLSVLASDHGLLQFQDVHVLLLYLLHTQERQSRQLCLQHTLNNMLQQRVFTQERLEQLADSLTAPTWLGLLSPHR